MIKLIFTLAIFGAGVFIGNEHEEKIEPYVKIFQDIAIKVGLKKDEDGNKNETGITQSIEETASKAQDAYHSGREFVSNATTGSGEGSN